MTTVQSRFVQAKTTATFRMEIFGDPARTLDDAFIDVLQARVDDAVRDVLTEQADIRLDGAVYVTMQMALEP